MMSLPEEIHDAIEALPTRAAQIRELDRRGYARADIARILRIRYQHVRNVLEQDRLKTEPDPRPAGAVPAEAEQAGIEPAAGTVRPVRIEIDAHGRLALPRDLLKAMLIPGGGWVGARVENGDLIVTSPRVGLRRAQEIARQYKKSGESVVDGFLAERRAMWGEE